MRYKIQNKVQIEALFICTRTLHGTRMGLKKKK